MAHSAGKSMEKKLIRIDVSSDTVCPWCLVGKKHLNKAMESSKDAFNFEIFRSLGLEYDYSGLTGNTLDSHRLITFVGHQGVDNQNALVEELFLNYFTQGKYIGDRQVLLDAAGKVGIEGASELLEDPNKGLEEVNDELEKYSTGIGGVPYYVINGKHKVSGAQQPGVFLK